MNSRVVIRLAKSGSVVKAKQSIRWSNVDHSPVIISPDTTEVVHLRTKLRDTGGLGGEEEQETPDENDEDLPLLYAGTARSDHHVFWYYHAIVNRDSPFLFGGYCISSNGWLVSRRRRCIHSGRALQLSR